MKINVVLPFFPKKPVGGIKIMYQYADLLSGKGHEVIIYHTRTLKYSPSKFLNPLRIIKNKLNKDISIPEWFTFKNKIDSRLINRITDTEIEDGNVILSTLYATALEVSELSLSKGIKYNFIQDNETWISDEKTLIRSYKLPIKHIVINDYLFNLVRKVSIYKPILIYNAIDTEIFKITEPIINRNNESVCMMYSEEKRKGSKYGLEALMICKEKHPNLKITFFSVYPQPKNLPEWISYYQSPKNLIDIYNKSAIYFTPSIGEGWALPPAEAMNCGCALICTNIGGHAAYAIDNQTALLTKNMNSNDMAEKLLNLIENNEKRISIASEGNKYIKKFTWENSINLLEDVLKN